MYRSASHGLQALRWSARTSAARRTYSQTVTAGQTTSSLSSKMRFAAMPFLSGILVAAVYDKYWPGEKTGKLPSATGLLPTAHAAEKPSGTEVPKPWALRNGNYAEDFKQAIEELQAIFPGDKIATADEDLTSHGVSPNTHHKASKNPACVFYPESTEDVSKAVKIANRYRMPVIPFSGGTSLEGHTTTPYGGMCVDFCRMNNILEIREGDADATVQAGVGWQTINEELADRGIKLFFPLDPGPGANIGGMMGTGCSGTNAMRYGTARSEWFLNATVVLPSGEIIKTRSRARKSSAGFDVTKLFIGAEGTLGIVTEATIRLTPLLPTRVAICAFPNVKEAVSAVTDVINKGVPLQCAEMCDDLSMKAINQSGLCETKFPEKDSVFFKFQGDQVTTDNAADKISEIVKKYGGTDLKFASSVEESEAIWHGRKSLHWSIMALKPGWQAYSTDVCVPISELPKLVYDSQADMKKSGLFATCLGHVGDGNVHFSICFEKDSDYAAVDAAASRMVKRAIELGGTCTGEHGVGVGKKRYLRKELGDGTVKLMQDIKDLIDPNGIMNPGKLYPDMDVEP